MPQRRAPELRPVMRPSYGACSACFCRRNTGRQTVDWRRAGFAAFAARFAAKAAAERCSDVLASSQGDIIYDALSKHQDWFVLSTITNTLANPRTTPLRPTTTKDASRAGRRRTQRCRAVPFVTASPGRLQIPETPR